MNNYADKIGVINLHMQISTATKLVGVMVSKGIISNAEASSIALEMLDDFNEDVEKLEMREQLSDISKWLEGWVTSFAEASKRERKD